MTANPKALFDTVGSMTATSTGQAVARSLHVANVLQTGYRLWFDSVASTLGDIAKLTETATRSRSTGELVAAQQAFVGAASNRISQTARSLGELSVSLFTPPAAPTPAEPESPSAEPAVKAAPAVETVAVAEEPAPKPVRKPARRAAPKTAAKDAPTAAE